MNIKKHFNVGGVFNVDVSGLWSSVSFTYLHS